MNKTIFDVLGKDIDLKKEVDKLEKLFSIEKIIKVQDDYMDDFEEITYKKLCDRHLALWDYINIYIIQIKLFFICYQLIN